jgi:hypothetical protein
MPDLRFFALRASLRRAALLISLDNVRFPLHFCYSRYSSDQEGKKLLGWPTLLAGQPVKRIAGKIASGQQIWVALAKMADFGDSALAAGVGR